MKNLHAYHICFLFIEFTGPEPADYIVDDLSIKVQNDILFV